MQCSLLSKCYLLHPCESVVSATACTALNMRRGLRVRVLVVDTFAVPLVLAY